MPKLIVRVLSLCLVWSFIAVPSTASGSSSLVAFWKNFDVFKTRIILSPPLCQYGVPSPHAAEILSNPITRALLPRDFKGTTEDQILSAVARRLEVPDLKIDVKSYYVPWLLSGTEAEWQSKGLDLQTGYSISRAASRTLSLRIANVHQFHLGYGRLVQCDMEFADLNGQTIPILLRTGPTPSPQGSPIYHIAVLLPVLWQSIPTDQIELLLAMQSTLRKAVLMGLGYSPSEAETVVKYTQRHHRNFDVYRLGEPSPEDLKRLDAYYLARQDSIHEDPQAVQSTYRALLNAETKPGKVLGQVHSIVAEMRSANPKSTISVDAVRQKLGEAFVIGRYRFIQNRLGVALDSDASAASMSWMVQELGSLYDEFLAVLVASSAR